MTKREQVIESHDTDHAFIFLDGYDDAIVGTVLVDGERVVCYSIPRMIHRLTVYENMTKEDAVEWLDYNVIYAYYGNNTPVFLEEL